MGGIAKTVEFNGYRFDLGGHRFYTKLKPVERLWEEMLGDEFLTRPTLSRIYYRNPYFHYPLQARNVVRQLGLLESVRCIVSYFSAHLRAHGREVRGLGNGPVRPTPVRALLSHVYGEGLGNPGVRDSSRVGRPAHQGLLVPTCRHERSRPQPRDADHADRKVSLSAARAGTDVGGLPAARRGGGDPGLAEPPQRHAPPRGRRRRVRASQDERERARVSRRRRPVEHSVERARSEPGSSAARRGCCRGPSPLVSRPLPRRADHRRGTTFSGQLGVHPRPGHASRARSELWRVERQPRRARDDLSRRRVPPRSWRASD